MKGTSQDCAIHRSTHRGFVLAVMSIALAATAVQCRRDVPQRASAAPAKAKKGTVPPAASPKGQKVLLVHSYHTGYPWVDAITQGAKRALAGSHAELEILYMDTKRKTSEEWKHQAGKRADDVVAEWQPDVVITADDNAQQYFAKNYAGRVSPQFVFCGVNAKPEKYGYPASNITGVLERPHYAETLRQLQQLVPDAKRVALLSDDSPTSAGAIEFIKGQTAPLELVSCDTPSSFADWQHAVRRCQDSADVIAIYTYHTVKRTGGDESMDPKEVMSWTVANSRIPIVGFLIVTVDDGALCGYLESGVEHGFRAGNIALELLGGKRAVDIPLVTALEGQSMLNMATARNLGIEVPQEVISDTEIVIGE